MVRRAPIPRGRWACRRRASFRTQRPRAGARVGAGGGGIGADALGARQVGALMFPIAQAYVSEAVLVFDDAIRATQRLLWDRLHLVVEPGGATALAALTSGVWVPPAGA